MIHNTTPYTDSEFTGNSALYGTDTSGSFATSVNNYLNNGTYVWKNWNQVFNPSNTSANVVTGTNSGTKILEEVDAKQGQIGDCYWIASSAAYAGHPNAASSVLT